MSNSYSVFFTRYRVADGRPMVLGQVSRSDLDKQPLRPGEAIIMGSFKAEDWIIVDGVPVPRTEPLNFVTVAQVKDEASRRIREIIQPWKIERVMSGGKAISNEDKAAAQAIRDRCTVLEVMAPIPTDFCNDKYWVNSDPFLSY